MCVCLHTIHVHVYTGLLYEFNHRVKWQFKWCADTFVCVFYACVCMYELNNFLPAVNVVYSFDLLHYECGANEKQTGTVTKSQSVFKVIIACCCFFCPFLFIIVIVCALFLICYCCFCCFLCPFDDNRHINSLQTKIEFDLFKRKKKNNHHHSWNTPMKREQHTEKNTHITIAVELCVLDIFLCIYSFHDIIEISLTTRQFTPKLVHLIQSTKLSTTNWIFFLFSFCFTFNFNHKFTNLILVFFAYLKI